MTTTRIASLADAIDAAQPSVLPSALSLLKLGTMLTPLKRTIVPSGPGLAIDLTADDDGLAALKVITLRATVGAVAGVLAGGTDAVQAFLAIDGPASASWNTVVQASALFIGTDGNGGAVTVAAVADGVNNGSNGGASMTQSGGAVTLHYISGTTTVADMERAIRGYGAGANITVKTQSTHQSYILLVGDDDFGATNLASGADMIPGSLDLSTLGSGELDTIVEYNLDTISAGNGLVVAAVPDAVGAVSLTDGGVDGAFIIHYIAATSTVTNVETALASLDGTIHTKTGGTGATVIPDLDATGVGTYIVGDAGATALDPTAVICGIAKLSDDGTTLTFLSGVGALVITYIPLPVSAAELAAPFPSL